SASHSTKLWTTSLVRSPPPPGRAHRQAPRGADLCEGAGQPVCVVSRRTQMADPAVILERFSHEPAVQNMSPALQTALFLGGLTLLPALLVSLTSFTRIVIVLGFARRAVTAQDIPPNSVLTGLSLFLTLFVMGPT